MERKYDKIYMCIDLKSFFASVECADMGLDPFTTNLAVADPSRGSGAICLAITPAMKALGIRNRCRVFEIPQGVEYITAMPRMKRYMEVSADIYEEYLKYISPEDIHVYSIDECFIDATPYLKMYNKTPRQLAVMLMQAVFERTHICATAGIGTNLFLAKVALDVTAKHAPDHIGMLGEQQFKERIWYHQPLTDIWGIGKRTEERLKKLGAYNLYDVTQLDEKALYKEFGINAQYLIDHAHGVEPCTMKEIHSYTAQSHSISNGQILFEDYSYDDALTVMKEMVDNLVLELVEKHLVAESISLSVGYSKDVKPRTGASRKLDGFTGSYSKLAQQFERAFAETTHRDTPIRSINIALGNVVDEVYSTIDLFTDFEAEEREHNMQQAILEIKRKYGKNALIRGMSLREKATGRKRNEMVGGHNGG
ncbi:MAG: DNA repair protein [Oscillospiraceae bacterium]